MNKLTIIILIVISGCCTQKHNREMIFGDKADDINITGDSILILKKIGVKDCKHHCFSQTLLLAFDSKGNDISDKVNRATCIFCGFSCTVEDSRNYHNYQP